MNPEPDTLFTLDEASQFRNGKSPEHDYVNCSSKLLIFDFFAGTNSSTQAFRDAEHQVIAFEMDQSFKDIDEYGDLTILKAFDLIAKYGRPDFIWASPPCTTFSVASIGKHWIQGGRFPLPKTEAAKEGRLVVERTLQLINDLNPRIGWLMENPRGMLRKLDVVKNLPRRTVTYCKYGDKRMKPTDIWGYLPNWEARQPCKNGDSCHVAAPRGSQTGTQGLANAKIKAMIPYELSKEIMEATEAQWKSTTF